MFSVYKRDKRELMEDTEYPTHYLVMVGMSGYLPESLNCYTSEASAMADAEETIRDYADIEGEDGNARWAYFTYKRKIKEVRQFGLVYLERSDYDIWYVEVATCDCQSPWEHFEGGEEGSEFQDVFEDVLTEPTFTELQVEDVEEGEDDGR